VHGIRVREENTPRCPGRRAALLRFATRDDAGLAVGEHYGYARRPGGVVHRRSVLRAGDDLWVIADALLGEGLHDARLQWLCGEFPTQPTGDALALKTRAGDLTLAVFDGAGAPQPLDVAAGEEDPPRGWLSRYFGEKVPVSSVVVAEARAALPWTRVTVVGAGTVTASVNGAAWVVNAGEHVARFTLRDGVIAWEEGV